MNSYIFKKKVNSKLGVLLTLSIFCFNLNAKHCLSCYGGGGGGSESYSCTSNSTLYVDASRPDDSGTGFSWATAKKNLQAAIWIANHCSVVTTILVAEGTYKPSTTTSTTARDYTFFIGNNYSILGGYPAGGGVRNWVLNPTILDGNIASGYESYHVVVIYDNTDNVTVDGFRIRNGFADGIGSVELDPGVFMSRSDGAGIYSRSNSNLNIKNCVIYDNTANGSSSRGAGLNFYASDYTLSNCVIVDNLTANDGGGLYALGGSIGHVTNCTFYDNYAFSQGGAIYNTTGTTINVANTIVWGNSNAANGGGTRNISYSVWQGGNTNNNNFNMDPHFQNTSDLNGPDNIWMTEDDGLNICKGSIALNRGNNTSPNIGLKDIKNQNRTFNIQVDIGAYELQNLPALASGSISIHNDSTVLKVFGGVTPFPLADCKIICSINPSSVISENITTVTKIENQNPLNAWLHGQWFVIRHYDIQDEAPQNNFNSKITLYFTNSEFQYYNLYADLDTLAYLPVASSPNNKSSLRVIQYKGTSPTKKLETYTGSTVIINPDDSDIVYNASTGYWSVSFDAVGFGGFFVTALNDFVFDGFGDFSEESNWLNNNMPASSLPAYNTITISQGAFCTIDRSLKLWKYSTLIVE